MPIPGMRGMEHIGFTVPNIDEACTFFEDILGATTLFVAATDFRNDDSDWMNEHLRVHPRSVIKEFRYLRLGNGSNLEVFEYESPDQATAPPKNSDIGGHHLAFSVDDMDAASPTSNRTMLRCLASPPAIPKARTWGSRGATSWHRGECSWRLSRRRMERRTTTRRRLVVALASSTLRW
mgnify:CR=1 FL=1